MTVCFLMGGDQAERSLVMLAVSVELHHLLGERPFAGSCSGCLWRGPAVGGEAAETLGIGLSRSDSS